MKTYEANTGTNRFCAPTVLSMLTGKCTDTYTKYCVRGRPGGMSVNQMCEALTDEGIEFDTQFATQTDRRRLLGIPTYGDDGYSYDEIEGKATFKQMLHWFDRNISGSRLFILVIGSHVALYNHETKMIIDNGGMFSREWTSIYEYGLRRVIKAFVQITGKVEEVVDAWVAQTLKDSKLNIIFSSDNPNLNMDDVQINQPVLVGDELRTIKQVTMSSSTSAWVITEPAQ